MLWLLLLGATAEAAGRILVLGDSGAELSQQLLATCADIYEELFHRDGSYCVGKVIP